MRQKLIFSIITFVFLYLYLQVLGWIWNRLFDIDPASNVLALLVILVLILPLSALSAHKSIDLIKAD